MNLPSSTLADRKVGGVYDFLGAVYPLRQKTASQERETYLGLGQVDGV